MPSWEWLQKKVLRTLYGVVKGPSQASTFYIPKGQKEGVLVSYALEWKREGTSQVCPTACHRESQLTAVPNVFISVWSLA